MVSGLFHRPFGLLFTFPSRYLFTIGLEKYLDLPVSSGGFPRAIRFPGYLRIETKKIHYFQIRGYHPLGLVFPDDSPNKRFCNFSAINGTSLPCNPQPKSQSVSTFEGGIRPTILVRFSLLRVRSPLLTECIFVFIPPGTEMFYFPGYAPVHVMHKSSRFTRRGFPIRTSSDQRLLGTSPKRIAATPRPSSLFLAKASTIRP